MEHFSKKTIRILARKGITLIGLQALPDSKGSWLNSETGYIINDNGTQRVLTYLQLQALAD